MDSVDALFATAPAVPAAQPKTAQPAADPHAAVDALFAGAAKQSRTPSAPGVLSYLEDAAGVPGSALASLPATVLAGYRGALGALSPGPQGQGAEVAQRTESAASYRPRTQAGQIAQDVLGYVPGKISQFGDWAGGKTTDALARLGLPPWMAAANGATLSAGIQVAPMFLERAFGIEPAARTLPARVSPEVAAARTAGFKLTPNQAMAKGALGGRIAESLAGHAKLERQVSRENSPAVTQIAGQEAGISGPVNAASIAAAKAPHNAVYDELSQLGTVPTDAAYRSAINGIYNQGGSSFAFDTPAALSALKQGYGGVKSFTAQDAVARLRQLRKEGNARLYGKYDPDQQALGEAQLTVAQALEDQIDRHLQGLAGNAEAGRGPVTIDAPSSGPIPQQAPSSAVVPRSGIPQGAGTLPGGSTALATRTLPVAARLDSPLAEATPAPSMESDETPRGSSARADWAQQAADLIPRFRAARASLAKINNVERAFKAGKGEAVSAASLAKQLGAGAPLTGGLRTIAESAQRFPRAFQDLHKIRDNGPFSNLDWKLAGPLAFLKPEALLPMLGPPGIRALLASDRYQRGAFGPFKSASAPLFSRWNRLALPGVALGAQAGNTQR